MKKMLFNAIKLRFKSIVIISCLTLALMITAYSLGIHMPVKKGNNSVSKIPTSTPHTTSSISPKTPVQSPTAHALKIATAPSWEQNFQSMTKLDTNVWRYDTDPSVPSGNMELEGYSPDNVSIKVGTGLIITAKKQSYSYPNDPAHQTSNYSSGRIDTKNSFSFTYGKIEATMKLPVGEGAWPAFWLLSANQPYTAAAADNAYQQPRFYLKNGELDVMESYGQYPDQVEGTFNSYYDSKAGVATMPGSTVNFHTYGIVVLPNSITWTIDGAAYYSYARNSNDPNAWPYTETNRLYPLLNLAISGSVPVDYTQAPWTFSVSDIKYYPYQ
jgi:beta-glucanase (GH16 family)